MTHPDEAKIDEGGCFPLADALWIENDPVPIDIVKTLITICPEALTDQAFSNASHSETHHGVLQLMFKHDLKNGRNFVKSDTTSYDCIKMDTSDQSDDASYVKLSI